MGFDLDKILSVFKNLGPKKKEKRNVSDYQEDENVVEEDFEEKIEDDVVDDEFSANSLSQQTQNKSSSLNKKKLIDFSNKKVKIIAGAGVLVVAGLISIPYIMSFIGEKQAEEVADISNINVNPPSPSISRPKHRPKPNRTISSPRRTEVTAKNHKNNNITHTQNRQKLAVSSSINKSNANRNSNFIKTNNSNFLPSMNNKNLVASNNKNIQIQRDNSEDKIKKIEKELENTNGKIREIQNHLLNATLTGQNDPIGLVDKTILENRNYDLYLQSQIQLMKKLIAYYKQRAELQKTLQLYKMAFGNSNSYQTNNYSSQNLEKQTRLIQQSLQKVVAPLQRQIESLKQELSRVQREKEKMNQKQHNVDASMDFKKMVSVNLNDLVIFAKNGKYIAVVHTDTGDKIFKEGDYLNGYKIEKILPDMIVFEKNGQKFYYNYNQTLNQDYVVAKITIPGTISTSEVKKQNKKEQNIKEYKTVSKQQLLQQLLQKRLQQMNLK